MDEELRARRVYTAHREKQRRHILQVAQGLFDQHGIDRVAMADIIAGSGLMRSTIYQYFPNKEEIVWAIVAEELTDSAQSIHAVEQMAHRSAYEHIQHILEHFASELTTNPQRVRFMAQFDALYARDWSPERLLALEEQIFSAALGPSLVAIIQRGIADRSLRPDLDPELTMHSLLNTIIATQRRLAALGSRVEQEYGQPIERLFGEACRILLCGIRAES
ncbi:MAG: hypothetical protein OHK0050_43880 [Roseiflexaceae bacterium]